MVERPAMAAAAEASNLVSQQHSAPTCDQAAPTSSGSSDPAPSVKAAVPDCVLRAIYPERYAAEPNSQSKAEAYAQSLQNAHDIKKATYQDIIWPMLQEQREKGITASPGEMGST
mmetsp:Transcript_15190/g.38058  ORF Transcript_15190/g.38058 Transcript_15190/m.38058 type:complete len:115 (+) Transcript_15190:99-443(+)